MSRLTKETKDALRSAGVQWNVTTSTPEAFAAARRVPDELVCPGSFLDREDGHCVRCDQSVRVLARTENKAARHKMPAWLEAKGVEPAERRSRGTVCACGNPKHDRSEKCWRCFGEERERARLAKQNMERCE